MAKKPADKKKAYPPGYPFSTKCRFCQAALKITSPATIGKRVACPKCGKKIDIVAPDDDGTIPYGVEAAPEPEPEPEPTEEELEEAELKEIARKRKILWDNIKWSTWTVILLSGVIGTLFWLVWALQNPPDEKKKEPGAF